MVISLIVLIAVLVGGFMVWEIYFSRRGRQAIMEQHHAEGNDEPPKTI